MVFQCIKCFNRFGIDRLLVDKEDTIVCPIDKYPVKQLLGKQAQEAYIEVVGQTHGRTNCRRL